MKENDERKNYMYKIKKKKSNDWESKKNNHTVMMGVE